MKPPFLFLAIAISVCCTTVMAQNQEYGLKDAYRRYFDIGVALNLRNVSLSADTSLITRNFSTVTAENAMKPVSVQPHEGVFCWEGADSIANFCRRNGIKMRGHCLCWHNQFADWMFVDSCGNAASKELFYSRLRNHIHAVVKRYRDVVFAWDVVNEAIADGPSTVGCQYRESRHFNLCGDEFIAKAFVFAREADSTALLFYNDYNAADPAKCHRICNMVEKMKKQGVPIDGIGMQGHYNVQYPSVNDVEAAIERYSQIVDVVHITEIDIRTNNEMGGQLEFSKGTTEKADEELQERHAERYASLFDAFRRHSDVVKNVTFWNLTDADSWIGADNYPLLFDKNGKTKKAYYRVRDFRHQ